VPTPRSRAQRRRDTEHRLINDIDVWVASASATRRARPRRQSNQGRRASVAVGQLVHLASGLDAARAEAQKLHGPKRPPATTAARTSSTALTGSTWRS
jgi:hypothetical protein